MFKVQYILRYYDLNVKMIIMEYHSKLSNNNNYQVYIWYNRHKDKIEITSNDR